MGYDIPDRFESQIENVALTHQITTDEALSRIIEAGLERFVPTNAQPRVPLASLFGTAKNGYGSREAVDRAIAEMRDEW